MKKILTLLILSSTISYAQSSFFAGINTSINSTTLRNKEDRTAGNGDMYKSKMALSSAYSISIGYSFKNNVQLFVSPNYMNFKHKMKGSCDTGLYNHLDGLIKFQTINLPVMLGYKYALNDRISIGINAGMYYNQVLSINERVEISNPYVDTTWKNTIVRTLNDNKLVYIFPDSNKYYVTGDEWLYKKENWGFCSQLDFNYSVSDNIMINIFIPFSYSFKDLENKKIVNYTYQGPVPGPSEYTFNYWENNYYARYYPRPVSEYSKRPATHTMALGFGIGINYYFSGGLLSAKNKN